MGCGLFRNKVMLNIDCIDFEEKCLSGHVRRSLVMYYWREFSVTYGGCVRLQGYKTIRLLSYFDFWIEKIGDIFESTAKYIIPAVRGLSRWKCSLFQN
jgi:hypothetical protein